MGDQGKLTEDERLLQQLTAQVRIKAREIAMAAEALDDSRLTVGARETAQMINAAAGRLSALVHQREKVRARVEQSRGTPVTFIGPAIRWCDATVPGTGAMHGFVVGCNRMLRDDGTCRHQDSHIPATKLGSAHRHIEGGGLTGPLCTAPLRSDGSCTAYPTSNA